MAEQRSGNGGEVDAGFLARTQRIAQRRAQGRQAATAPRVRVVPRDETIRRYIVHWPTGIAFPAEGSVEWPNDRFTQRRIADGDVKLEEEAKPTAPSRSLPRQT